jgi:hypothetical protein
VDQENTTQEGGVDFAQLPPAVRKLLMENLAYGPIVPAEEFLDTIQRQPRSHQVKGERGPANRRRKGQADRRIVYRMRCPALGKRAEYHATKGWRLRSVRHEA